MSVPKKLKSNTLGLTELARLEDLFLSSFEEAVEKVGVRTCVCGCA